MAHRLTKICTRTGDDGSTGLGDGSRVSKNNPRIHALGEVDELNCAIGLILTESLPDSVTPLLTDIQHDLFDLGGELCSPGTSVLDPSRIEVLEHAIAEYNATLTPLKDFVLPGGSRSAAHAHLARAICRRAERAVVALAESESVAQAPRLYLNRLSDLLFILSRVINRAAGQGDMLWKHRTKK